MPKVTLRINEINYKSIGNKLLKIADKPENASFAKRLFTRIGALAINNLPISLLENLIIKIINTESQTICSVLTKLAKENGIDLSVSNLSVTK